MFLKALHQFMSANSNSIGAARGKSLTLSSNVGKKEELSSLSRSKVKVAGTWYGFILRERYASGMAEGSSDGILVGFF